MVKSVVKNFLVALLFVLGEICGLCPEAHAQSRLLIGDTDDLTFLDLSDDSVERKLSGGTQCSNLLMNQGTNDLYFTDAGTRSAFKFDISSNTLERILRDDTSVLTALGADFGADQLVAGAGGFLTFDTDGGNVGRRGNQFVTIVGLDTKLATNEIFVFQQNSTNPTLERGIFSYGNFGLAAPVELFPFAIGEFSAGLFHDTTTSALYWADTLANEILSGDDTGAGVPQVLYSGGALASPLDVAIPSGTTDLYIGNSTNVLRGSVDGLQPLSVVNGSFDNVQSISVDEQNGDLYLCDNNGLSRIDLVSSQVTSELLPDTYDSIRRVTGVEFSQDGTTAFWIDSLLNDIHSVDLATGESTLLFDGLVNNLVTLGTLEYDDASELVYFYDPFTASIRTLDANGNDQELYGGLNFVTDFVIRPEEGLIYASQGSIGTVPARIFQASLDGSGNISEAVPLPPFTEPRGLDVDSDGVVYWTSDTALNRFTPGDASSVQLYTGGQFGDVEHDETTGLLYWGFEFRAIVGIQKGDDTGAAIPELIAPTLSVFDRIDLLADSCPQDPLKTLPGVCGCGVADIDTDMDGSFDCIDACPSDPGKSAAGVCGCGVADLDSDMDGTLDCAESCPDDANKTEAGICGCGRADEDGNSNGVIDCLTSEGLAINISETLDAASGSIQSNGDFRQVAAEVRNTLWFYFDSDLVFPLAAGVTEQDAEQAGRRVRRRLKRLRFVRRSGRGSQRRAQRRLQNALQSFLEAFTGVQP